MNYKISVIIPCYNAEKTLKRALISIINQTIGFENIEILLYDDASKDNTKKIIEEYSKNYTNILGFYGEINKGPGFGRNKCLENSTGEYMLFLDSDDEFDSKMCEKLYLTIKSENADFVSCGMLRHDNIEISKRSFEYDFTKASENYNEKIIFIDKNVFYLKDSLSTSCLFKQEIIKKNNIRFLEAYYSEDLYFKAIFKTYSKKAVYLKNYFGYIHHAYTDSITSDIDLNDLNEIHDVQLKILKEIRKFNLDLAYMFKGHIACSLIRLYALNLLKSQKKEIINFLKRMREFEIDINFHYSFDPLINILNNLIMKEQYNLAYLYLHFLRVLYNSKNLRKIYRSFSIK